MTKQEISLNRFTETGPIARGEIYADEHSFLLNKNSRIAAPCVKVKLLVDTGANISGIDWRIISALNLNRYDENLEVNGVGGTHSLNRFRCVLFLNIFGLKGLPIDVVEGNYSGSPYDGIIGRDVLQFCSFRYHGPTNTFELQALDF
jgi:hypothetical protein